MEWQRIVLNWNQQLTDSSAGVRIVGKGHMRLAFVDNKQPHQHILQPDMALAKRSRSVKFNSSSFSGRKPGPLSVMVILAKSPSSVASI